MKKTFLFLIFVLMAIPAFALTSGKIPVATSTSSPGIPSVMGDSDITDISGDVYTNGWSDYSASSTINGWSSFTTKQIYYKKIGKLVFVSFYISGTSNTTGASFTVPYAAVSNTSYFPMLISCFVIDNGINQAYPGLADLGAGSSQVNITKDMTGGATPFTASGTKQLIGQFWYQTN
jgi:hypothetical protein